MKKAFYKHVLEMFTKRNKHVSKPKHFQQLVPNPPGSKFRKWCNPESKRAADGTLRQ